MHNRLTECYEMFSFNLYPGPSAKKGVYGMLIDLGERENWVTAHCSTVQVITPYDNVVTIMHEGASGGGKSEMLEQAHREQDGRWMYGENLITGETRHLVVPRSCDLHPVSDDMALCHPSIQNGNGKMMVMDAEDAWFVRVNHITTYGADPYLEKLTAKPDEPLMFLNIDAVPTSRALIWEHTEDSPGVACPNPRVIVPRRCIPNIVDEPVQVDVRSFGVRMPPCTKEIPTYGIMGLFHIVPPALAWLWRLVAPRGYNNPSIIDTEGLSSEGVGSYWPFSTGRKVNQANLLLDQFAALPAHTPHPDAKPAHRRLEGGFYGGVDYARIPGSPRQLAVQTRPTARLALPAAGLHPAPVTCGRRVGRPLVPAGQYPTGSGRCRL